VISLILAPMRQSSRLYTPVKSQQQLVLRRVRKLCAGWGMARHELTDEQWERLAPLLPPQKPHTGRPNRDHRTIINGLLWLLRTGAPWRDLPERYGSWKTVASRLYRWQRAEIWQRILQGLQQEADADGTLDWSLHYVDGTIIRAHQHAAGTRRPKATEHPDEGLGRSQGGFSTKIHLRAEGGGKPISFLITAGQRHEQSVFEALMETGAVRRARQGRPRIRPDRVAGDKSYSSRKIRRYLRRRGIGAVIPRQKRERRTRFDKAAYRQRNHVERLVNRLKGFRRIATRYEKRAVNYLGMLTVAAIALWL
jgi:transposase